MTDNFCFVVVPGNPVESAIGAVAFKESGYYASTYTDRKTLDECRELVDLLNGRLGINREVEAAMLAGSMFGWDVPGAKAARDHFAGK